jgi:hypothetical protein
MINLQPLIEKFKKAIYGRDVRQSIVDLAQAIGDNHNEQEGLRNETINLRDQARSLKDGTESLWNKTRELRNETEEIGRQANEDIKHQKDIAEASINNTKDVAINALNSKQEEIENLANAKGTYLESETQSLKRTLIDLAETKDKEIKKTADEKINEITTTATTESEKLKSVITETNKDLETYKGYAQQLGDELGIAIDNGTKIKEKLENTTKEALKTQENLAGNIHDYETKLKNNEVVTKKELNEVKNLIPPSILAVQADNFIWYLNLDDINFYNSGASETDKTRRVEAYCNIKLSDVKEKIRRDGDNLMRASLNIAGWDRLLVNNTPFITPDTQVFVNIAGLKEARPFSSELKENSVNVCWESPKGEESEAEARIFVKLVTFY